MSPLDLEVILSIPKLFQANFRLKSDSAADYSIPIKFMKSALPARSAFFLKTPLQY
jgi:hypothetical protein